MFRLPNVHVSPAKRTCFACQTCMFRLPNVHVSPAKRTCFACQTYMFRLPNVHVLGVKQRVKKFAPNGCLQMVIFYDLSPFKVNYVIIGPGMFCYNLSLLYFVLHSEYVPFSSCFKKPPRFTDIALRAVFTTNFVDFIGLLLDIRSIFRRGEFLL